MLYLIVFIEAIAKLRGSKYSEMPFYISFSAGVFCNLSNLSLLQTLTT